jgi:hypothetical protein
MTEQTAQKIADATLAVAAVGAVYVILKTPALRRFAVGLAITGLTGAVPAWITRELQQAWTDSGRGALS